MSDLASITTPVVEKRPFWQTPWKFAVHGAVGTCIFTVIAAFAVGLDFLVQFLETYKSPWLPTYHVSQFILVGLTAVEYAVFLTDIVLFGVFLWRTAKGAIKEL